MSNTEQAPLAESPLFIRSVGKTLRVLETLGSGDQPLSLREIAERCGLNKSAAQRVTHSLLALGYLEQCPRTRRFTLGRKLLDLSYNYLRNHPIVREATPVMIELRRRTRERVDLSLPDDTSLIYVVRLQSKRETFSATLVGRRMPLYCTSGGRAILAALSEEEAEEIVYRSARQMLTPNTRTDPKDILDEVRATRARGYGINVEECLPGELAVGKAVLNGDRRPMAAIHVSGSLEQWSVDDFTARMAPLAIQAADSLQS